MFATRQRIFYLPTQQNNMNAGYATILNLTK